MKLSLPTVDLAQYVSDLLDHYIPDGGSSRLALQSGFSVALERLEYCFSRICLKYYQESDEVTFDHLHSDHMASFLWFLSNTIHRSGDFRVADKIGYLNKIMHGVDLYPSVQMPDIFLLVHPVGTVLGSATYQDFLVVYQGVTVGAVGHTYPSLGRANVLYSGAKIIGDSRTGDNVIFAANSFLVSRLIPSNSLVLGQFPHNRIKPNRESVISDRFNFAK